MKEDSLPGGIRARSRSPSPPQTQQSTSQQTECKPQLLPQTSRKRRSQPLGTFVALVLTSALTSELLARLAHRSTLTVLSFPFWTSTSLLLVVYRVRKRRKESHDKEGLLSATKNILGSGGRGTKETTRILATAASFVGSLALRIWTLRRIDTKEAQAIEVGGNAMLLDGSRADPKFQLGRFSFSRSSAFSGLAPLSHGYQKGLSNITSNSS